MGVVTVIRNILHDIFRVKKIDDKGIFFSSSKAGSDVHVVDCEVRLASAAVPAPSFVAGL